MRWILGDTETSGFGPDSRVCEIAWVEVDEDLNVLDSQHSLIDPQCRISASASGVHGITDADVADAPTMAEFFEHIVQRRYIADEPSVFIAHNSKFDLPYFKPYLPKLAGTLCTLRLARKLLTDAENHKLPTLMYQYDLERGESHTADGDVRTTLDLLRLLVKVSGASLNALMTEANLPIFIEKWPFGKHKDVPLVSSPRDYCQWAVRNMKELDPDLKWSIEQVLAGNVPV